jgi:inner membrane protein
MKGMFLFGHIGVTLGAMVLINGLTRINSRSSKKAEDTIQPNSDKILKESEKTSTVTGWFENLGRFLDIRLLLIGSMLPDIIDKPLGYFVNFGNGRSITHTLLVTLLILVIAIYLYLIPKKSWLLAIAFGMIAHLILDLMWMTPVTFYWPLYGWEFPLRVDPNWIGPWLSELTTNRLAEAFETAGLLIILTFIWDLISHKKLLLFLTRGDTSASGSKSAG